MARVLQRMYNKPRARLGTTRYDSARECGNRDTQLRLRRELLPSMPTEMVCEAPCMAAAIRHTSLTFADMPMASTTSTT